MQEKDTHTHFYFDRRVRVPYTVFMFRRKDMTTKKQKDYRIVVLQRGWVVVGEYAEDEKTITVKNGSVIRRWGTTKGLGELAIKGALPNTILDQCTEIKAGIDAVVMTLKTDAGLWDAK
jgi:hypothetical protein